MQRFVVLKNLTVTAPTCEANGFYEDIVLRIEYVPLVRTANPATDNDHESMVMAYVCQLKPRPGALIKVKCLEKGVPPGPLFGVLKNGEDITLSDGTVVRAKDVCEPDDPAQTFLVVDIPSVDYLESLRTNEVLRKQQQTEDTELVVHFSPSSVMETETYRTFAQGFGGKTRHLLINGSGRFSGYVASHRMQWQLNQLHDGIFPLLKEPLSGTVTTPLGKRLKLGDNEESETSQESNVIRASAMTAYHFRPSQGLDHTQESRITPDEFVRETAEVDGFVELLDALRIEQQSVGIKNNSDSYPRVVFLGTGSCIPNKNRNVSAILVHTT